MEFFVPYLFGIFIWGASALMLVFRKTQWLLIFSIVLATSQSSSVLNFSFADKGHGIEPALISFFCFMVSVFFEKDRNSYVQTVKKIWPFYIFLIWALILNFLGPFLFKGLTVANPWFEGPGIFEPLRWTYANLTYSIYLLFYFAVFTSILVDANLFNHVKVRQIFIAIFFAFILVFIISAAQVYLYLSNRMWPVFLLNNRLGVAQLYDQQVAGMVRASSTFIEPSQLALYLSGLFFGTLFLLIKSRNLFFIGFLVLMLLISSNFFLTLSSTAYLVMLIGCIGALIISFFYGKKYELLKCFLLIVLIIGVFFIQSGILHAVLHTDISKGVLSHAATAYSQNISQGFQDQFFHKMGTDSFHDRSMTDLQALKTFCSSYFMGVGGGSFRASSFFASFLVGNGLIGLILIFWFFIKIFRLNKNTKDRSELFKTARIFFGLCFLGDILAASISVADINIASLWINLALWVSFILLKEEKIKT